MNGDIDAQTAADNIEASWPAGGASRGGSGNDRRLDAVDHVRRLSQRVGSGHLRWPGPTRVLTSVARSEGTGGEGDSMTATGAVPVPPTSWQPTGRAVHARHVARVVLTAAIVGLLVYYVGFSEIATTVAQGGRRRRPSRWESSSASTCCSTWSTTAGRCSSTIVGFVIGVRHLSRPRRQSGAARARSPPVGVDGDRRRGGCCGALPARRRP